MNELRQIEHDILARGRVDGHDLEVLRRWAYVGGKVGRPEADFLVSLHRRVQHRSPSFDQFFYRAVKDHLLADARIEAEEADWLRQVLLADGTIDDEERTLLHELRGEAGQVSPEFEQLYQECLKQPREQRTCG
jgi:hypothetical protein